MTPSARPSAAASTNDTTTPISSGPYTRRRQRLDDLNRISPESSLRGQPFGPEVNLSRQSSGDQDFLGADWRSGSVLSSATQDSLSDCDPEESDSSRQQAQSALDLLRWVGTRSSGHSLLALGSVDHTTPAESLDRATDKQNSCSEFEEQLAAPKSESFLLWSLDYGHRTLSALTVDLAGTRHALPELMTVVRFQQCKDETVNQDVGYFRADDGTWQFIWGHDLKMRLGTTGNWAGKIIVFKWLKVAVLGREQDASYYRSLIEEDLKRLKVPEKTVQDLFVRHLQEIKAELLRISAMQRRCAVPDLPRIWTFWNIPRIADLGSRKELADCLNRAEWGDFSLVFEDESAGSWHAYKHMESSHRHLDSGLSREGDGELVVVDGGGYTVNTTSFVMPCSLDGSARAPLRPTGKTLSEALGSEMVITKRAIFLAEAILSQKHGELDQGLDRLGISRAAYADLVARKIESYKSDFQDELDVCDGRTIRITGVWRAEGERPNVTFDVSANLMRTWFEDAKCSIRACIDQHINDKTEAIVLTGGLFRNTYLIDALETDYRSEHNIVVITAGKDSIGNNDLSVVRGAAPRFVIQPSEKPFEFALGIMQDEYWDEEYHDAVDRDEPEDSVNVIRIPGEDLIVRDRWRTLLPWGEMVDSETDIVHNTWLQIDVADHTLSQRGDYTWEKVVFWTDQDIPDHVAVDRDGIMRKDVHEYQKISVRLSRAEVKQLRRTWKTVDRLDKSGRIVMKNGRASKLHTHRCRLLWLRIQTRTRGMDVIVRLARAPPWYNPYGTKSNKPGIEAEFEPPSEEMLISIAQDRLLDSRRSAFAQQHTGDPGPGNLELQRSSSNR